MIAPLQACAAYLGRKPCHVATVGGIVPVVEIGVFPAVEGGWLKWVMSAAPGLELAVTAGAAQLAGGGAEYLITYPGHQCAQYREPSVRILEEVVNYLASSSKPVEMGDSIDLTSALPESVALRIFLCLPVPDPLDEKALKKRLKPASEVLSLIPITEAELELKKAEGLEALLDFLEAQGVSTLFEMARDHSEPQ